MTAYAEAARDLLRATVLDAARAQLGERPWEQVTMAQVARAAGVSRQTLYNEFGSREALAQALILRESDVFLAAVEAAVTDERHEHLGDALSAAFEVFLDAAREDPIVRAVVSGDGNEELLTLVTTHGTPVIEHGVERLAAAVLEHWPPLRRADTVVLAEIVVRLAISMATQPDGPAALDARAIAGVLRPHVDTLLS